MTHDYDELGLVAGLEIHQQLDTASKLFCGCPTERREPEASVRSFTRYLHPTKSELGEIDEAALEESRVDREFEYLAFDTTCLVEEDDEPPARLDEEALGTALEIATLMDCTVVDRAHVMRKIVVDGSNTTGFQRSTLVATDGEIETDDGPVGIADMLLEEESAARIEEREGGVTYGLDRLGIPLVEIGTKPDIRTPEQAREAAERIGMLLRSTGKVKRGLGTIRQDVNVSIAEGARVEMKGVQSLDDIDDLVAGEAGRQVELLEIAEELDDRDAAVAEPTDVTDVFADTDSGVIAGAESVLGVRLAGFDGLVGREIQPDRRLGTELSDHAKRQGAAGSSTPTSCPPTASPPMRSTRCVRPSTPTRTTRSRSSPRTPRRPNGRSRPSPNARRPRSRGFPRRPAARTTTAPRGISGRCPARRGCTPKPTCRRSSRTLPTSSRRSCSRSESNGIGPGSDSARGWPNRSPTAGTCPPSRPRSSAASTRRRRRVRSNRRSPSSAVTAFSVEALADEHLLSTLDLVSDGELANEGIGPVLTELAADPSLTAEAAIEAAGLSGVDREAVRETVVEVIERNAEQVDSEGMAAFSGLMGECMGALRGKADGEVVSELLREEMGERT